MSFTTVSALAKDNGYRMVVVLAGTTQLLLDQSRNRLVADLGIEDPDSGWVHLASPTTKQTNSGQLYQMLHDPRSPVVVATVMKNPAQIRKLAEVFESLAGVSVPVLVVDDEADQATPNTLVSKGKQSSTYAAVERLRASLPHHTYLQYTATPQAPLLVGLSDSLSPDFAVVLTPGQGYTGGLTFFDGGRRYLRLILDVDRNESSNLTPESLKQALRCFLLGTAAQQSQGMGSPRSMMVHPSRGVSDHATYARFVTTSLRTLRRSLDFPDTDGAKRSVLAYLRESHKDLAATVTDLPPLEDLLPKLRLLLDDVKVVEVNSTGSPDLDWDSSPAWILVGGQLLDRGFTVEGLSVTYMPRSLGVGNADTLQQRARFFGYKGSYLSYCRIWLDTEVEDAFRQYVMHEENVRSQLKELTVAGQSLSDWRRSFLLDPILKPTRQSVIVGKGTTTKFADSWYRQGHVLHGASANIGLVQALRSSLSLERVEFGSRRVAHYRASVTAKDLFREFLVPFVAEPEDSVAYAALLCQLASCMDDGLLDGPASLYFMGEGGTRRRSANSEGVINQLFQGRDPSGSASYGGDESIQGPGAMTVQVHDLDLMHDGRVLASAVPAIAVFVPSRLGRGIYTLRGNQ